MEPVTQPILQPRHASRAIRRWLVVALAALACAPGLAAPRGAVAIEPAAARVADKVEVLAPKAKPETPADEPSAPSIQYEQAMEHEGDVIAFAPGDRVTVPFKPRADDDWKVDGKEPHDLPAGHATGKQMRDAPKDRIWAAGQPSDALDVAEPDPVPDSGVEPASYVVSGTEDARTAAKVSATGLRREIFGFLPYWEVDDSSTTLDWRTLSTVAYFSVGCTSSGALAKTDADGSLSSGWAGWTSSKMTSIINAAHHNQTRVVLTISCFAWSGSGASRQAALLGSATARSTLAKAAAAAVRDRGADGINLDFEPIVAGYADEFTALVRSVRSELNKVAPGYQLTFDTMGSIGNQPIVAATAPGGADAVFIMGYDYRTDGSSVAGSQSPLTGPRYDLTDTIKAYTAKISPSKIILGVPYYGRAWSTATSAVNAPTLSPAKYGAPAAPTYVQAADLVAQYGRRYDSVEQSPWTAYRKETCTTAYGCNTAWRELYYDDAASLRLRYDLVNRTSLRGAGIWALGYDGTRPELRQALADKFLADKTPPVVGVTTLAQTQRDEGFRVGWSSWDDSSIKGYDVQVSVDGGAWTSWLTGTTLTSSVYLGTNGRAYAFRVRATDIHGNVSAWNGASPAATGVPSDITVGGFATVLVDGLRLRSAPSTSASIMTTLSGGDALQVIGGPVSGEGYTWFQVAGPVQQWGPVDPIQVGGWIAASGNGATNAGPRRPVYATRINAGITGLKINNGGQRVLTPSGWYGTMHLAWTNQRSFDSLALRVFRGDGTLAGTVPLGGTGSGAHGSDWDGEVGGAALPAGTYVLQLQGMDGGTTYSAASASPVSPAQIARNGIVAGPAAPTAVLKITAPPSPTRSSSLTWKLTFGGHVSGLSKGDLVRTGTATGCTVGGLAGDGTNWTITLTGCSAGTVTLGIRARTVHDAVNNMGPSTQVSAPTVLIDRSAPRAATPKVTLRSGVTLGSTSPTAPTLANLNVSAADAGGAGVQSYDVKRSVDGGAFASLATGLTVKTLAVALTPGHTYRFEVRARDKAGNVGGWVAGPTLRSYLPQQTSAALTWKGTWVKVLDDRFSGASDRYATTAGASVSYSFTGRAIAWLSYVAPSNGAARVYIDGVLATTVDLHSASKSFKRVAFARTWSSSGFHTIRIVVVGTTGHARVDVDAFEVLR